MATSGLTQRISTTTADATVCGALMKSTNSTVTPLLGIRSLIGSGLTNGPAPGSAGTAFAGATAAPEELRRGQPADACERPLY